MMTEKKIKMLHSKSETRITVLQGPEVNYLSGT